MKIRMPSVGEMFLWSLLFGLIAMAVVELFVVYPKSDLDRGTKLIAIAPLLLVILSMLYALGLVYATGKRWLLQPKPEEEPSQFPT